MNPLKITTTIRKRPIPGHVHPVFVCDERPGGLGGATVCFLVLVAGLLGFTGCRARPEPPDRPTPDLQQLSTTPDAVSKPPQPTVVGVTQPASPITTPGVLPVEGKPSPEFQVEGYFSEGPGTQALVDFNAKRYAEAAVVFARLAETPGDPAQQRAAGLLAGLAELRSGKAEAAAKRFSDLVQSYPLLADYHRRFATEAYFNAGDLDATIRMGDQVDPSGPNAAEVSLFKARALARLDVPDWPKLEQHLEKHIQTHGRSAEAQLLLGDALAGQPGKEQEAALSYRLVLARWPLSDKKSAATTQLKKVVSKIPTKDRPKWENLNHVETLMRGRKLYDAHRSTDAIEQLVNAADLFPKGSDERCEAITLAARSYDKLRTRKEGHPLYARGRSECARSKWMADILFFGGQSLYRSGKNADALDYFEALHELFPDVSYNDDALVYEAQIHGETKAPKKRKQTLERALKDYPDGDMRDEASWLLLWDTYQRGDMAETIRIADRLLAESPRETLPWSEGRTLYWKARALSLSKQFDAAREVFRQTMVDYPLSYYAQLAYGRLVELDGQDAADRIFQEVVQNDPAPTQTIAQQADPTVFQQEPFLRGVEFIRVGLLQFAQAELSRLKTESSESTAWVVAQLYDHASAHNISHNIARRKHPGFRRHYPKDAHAQRWYIAYPRPYVNEVATAAVESKIPEGLVYGIMREESGFNPTIESWANAVGLMQLLVPTARDLATPADVKTGETIDRYRLHDPTLNVRLGARFLGQLSQKLGHFALAAAGYNAGLGGARSFLKSRPGIELDEFVEHIPYRQTRRYVASTMSSFGTYTYLYTGKPLLLSFDVPALQ